MPPLSLSLHLNPPPFLRPHSVDSRRIKNPTARSLFDNALVLGGDVVVRVERVAKSLSTVR